MEPSWLNALKYFGLLLTAGTAFAGTWLVDFTSKDERTGRKKLTQWGRIGFPVAAVALLCSIVLSVWTDHDAATKRRLAAEQAATESAAARKQAEEDRKALHEARQFAGRAAEDTTRVLEAIKTANLSPDDKEKVQEAVKSLKGIEDYKTKFPELYARMLRASSFEEVRVAVTEGMEASVISRIAPRPECVIVKRPEQGMPNGFPSGYFLFNASASLSYVITPAHVNFGFTDPGGTNVGANGYSVVFEDGLESDTLQCNRPNSRIMCESTTSDPIGKKVYMDLQRKLIVAVKSGEKRHEVPGETARRVRTTFGCIAP